MLTIYHSYSHYFPTQFKKTTGIDHIAVHADSNHFCRITTIVQNIQKVHITIWKQPKNSWGSLLQTGSEITEKEQLLCNTHNVIICHVTLMPFHQPGTGR